MWEVAPESAGPQKAEKTCLPSDQKVIVITKSIGKSVNQ